VNAGKRKFLALAFAAVLVLPAILSQRAFADGLFEVNIPASIGDRQASLFVKINPPVFTTETKGDAYMQFRLFDARNNETIKFTTFIITVTKGTNPAAKPVLPPTVFHTESGLLTLKITPEPTDKVQIFANVEDILNAYKADPGGTINLRGPLLLEGGLYHFNIQLLTVDNIRKLFPPGQEPTFDTYLSVGDVSKHDVQSDGKTYPVTLISYYDKVKDFNFDAAAKKFSWSMPFDWNISRINAADSIFVHEEIKVPKSFAGVGDVSSYEATVNGMPIAGRMLAVDPFSSETEQILHFLINRNDILSLESKVPKGASDMTFSFTPSSNSSGVKTSGEIATDTGGVHVLLDWPEQMGAGKETTLHLQFIDAFSGNKITSNVLYDLRVVDDQGNEVYKLADQTANGGAATQTMTFPADKVYRIEVAVKALQSAGTTPDLTRNGVARGTVVVPEFPAAAALVAAAGILGAIIVAARLTRAGSNKK
jgi:hypothetical protein